MRRPGTFQFRGFDELEQWLQLAPLSRAIVLAVVDGCLELELPVEDEDTDEDEWAAPAPEHTDIDDLERPLWLVPPRDEVQRVTLRGATIDLDRSGARDEDPKLSAIRSLVDEWDLEADGLVLTIRFTLRGPMTPDLVLRGQSVDIVVHEPETRPALLATHPDIVELTFSGPIESPSQLVGVSWAARRNETGTFAYELRRAAATPEVFVELLRTLAESPNFIRAASGDEIFDRAAWSNYVTPHRRPWL